MQFYPAVERFRANAPAIAATMVGVVRRRPASAGPRVGRCAWPLWAAAVVVAAWWCGGAGEASAQQMFRSGRAAALSSGGVTTADLSGTGQIQGNERFIRKSSAGGFIGNDPRQRRGFVGGSSTNITGRVRAAAEQARVTMAPSVNREAASTINRSTGIYEPRLAIGFEVERPSDVQVTVRTVLQLHLTHAFPPTTRIEVSVADGIATLRGEVLSERDRSLAEQLVLFEPGIAGVRNELRLSSSPPAVSPTPPPTPTAPKPASPPTTAPKK